MKFTIAILFTLATLAAAAPPFDPAGVKNVGNGNGGQFIGGQCLSDADCGSGCCANPSLITRDGHMVSILPHKVKLRERPHYRFRSFKHIRLDIVPLSQYNQVKGLFF
ncbi:hypothetical protein M422DRAFT_270978 [Sphaerobolus stellatus SS14]|uniref:Hydrophobin n=1 Tax=Sphaerobolus stellatus (strain SS14) TaxID=990650 RepID=A0A0C9UFM2_SPHS4|nr:hypothetical protein M422DRAFT_270978 [Sphaerobolus stellatus SS14]